MIAKRLFTLALASQWWTIVRGGATLAHGDAEGPWFLLPVMVDDVPLALAHYHGASAATSVADFFGAHALLAARADGRLDPAHAALRDLLVAVVDRAAAAAEHEPPLALDDAPRLVTTTTCGDGEVPQMIRLLLLAQGDDEDGGRAPPPDVVLPVKVINLI